MKLFTEFEKMLNVFKISAYIAPLSKQFLITFKTIFDRKALTQLLG